jgi:8-oxo-dGTP diphosphatase / 2-hydroxy-dATP diphosphatase
MINKQTLVIIHEKNKVLLGLKKRGFGQGRWNGFGGKVNLKETTKDAAKRELLEETTIKVSKLNKIGILKFSWVGKDENLEVHIFKVKEFFGRPKETEEMKPRWFPVDKIPFKKMWSDDQYWFKHFLVSKKFKGKFIFDQYDQVVSYQLKKVDKL